MTTPKVALITGITGQHGSYLAELLLNKGYVVHGIKRRTSLFNTDRIDHLVKDRHEKDVKLFLHHGDMTDSMSLTRIIHQVQPDEIYNLAAQSQVAVSFEEPAYTANADGIGAPRVLEAIRILGLEKKTHYYQALSSELYGLVHEAPQKETTPFYPRSPYSAAKLAPTGSPPTTAKRMASMPLPAFCLTTSLLSVVKHSSHARLPARWHASSSGCKIAFTSAA